MTEKESFFKNNSLPEISPEEITFGNLLGKGAFSKVYQGKCRGQEIAVKIFEGAKNDEQELESIRAEIKVMSQIYNQNVVLFMGACTDPQKELMIVTEKLPSDLNKILIEQKDKYPLSLRKRMKMAKEAALGVNWLHCSNPMFIHRDLKPSNLLVSSDYHVKVADFGLTKMKDKTSKKQNNAPQGSPAYMAPEVFMGEYDEKCDVYSFGMVLWEIYQQEKVFKEYPNLPSLMHAVIDEGVRPEIPKNCPSRLRKLMQRCWDEDPKKRPSMSKVVSELENVILDVSIQDHTARKMWREKLNSENCVPWSTFAKVACQELEFDQTPNSFEFNELPLDLKCFHEVVAEKPKKKKNQIYQQFWLPSKSKTFWCYGTMFWSF